MYSYFLLFENMVYPFPVAQASN